MIRRVTPPISYGRSIASMYNVFAGRAGTVMITVPPDVLNRVDSKSVPPMSVVDAVSPPIDAFAVAKVTVFAPIPRELYSVPTPIDSATLAVVLVLDTRMMVFEKSSIAIVTVPAVVTAFKFEEVLSLVPDSVAVDTVKIVAAISYLRYDFL